MATVETPPTLPGSNGSKVPVPADSLDPTVALLGRLIGLLQEAAGSGPLELDTGWFADPLAAPDAQHPDRRSIRTIPTNPEQTELLLKLLAEFLGSVSASAVGVPGSGRTWYSIDNPLAKPGEDKATGLYLVTAETVITGGRADAAAKSTVVGLGMTHTFQVDGVSINPYAYFPLLIMPPEDGRTFVLGQPDHPIEIGVEVSDPVSPFGVEDVSFDGAKVAATIDFTDHPLALDLVLLNLKVGDRPPADTSVNDLIHTPPNRWIETGTYLLISQLVKAAPEGEGPAIRNMAKSLLSVLGVVGGTPAIDWGEVVTHRDQAATILTAWLQSIAGSPAALKRWLEDWYCLFHGKPPGGDTVDVTGAGTRANPWAIQLLSAGDDAVSLSLTVASQVDPVTKDLLVYPGVRIASKEIHPVASAPKVGVRVEASTEVVELTLPGSGKAPPEPSVFPSFRAMAAVLEPTAALQADTSKQDDTSVIRVGSIRGGFEYRAPRPTNVPRLSAETAGIYPTFLLTEVQTPYGSWDSIDLTNFDEVVRDAGDALSNLVQKKLDEFFDVQGDSSPAKIARGVAAGLGVEAPVGNDGKPWPNWPVKLLIPGVGVESFIKAPLPALGSYYTRCIETVVNPATQEVAWMVLLRNVAVALGDVSAQTRKVTGTGSAGDPWQVEMFSDDPNQPAVYLQSWRLAEATAAQGPEVCLALAFVVPLPVRAVDMAFLLRADLLRLRLPTGQGVGEVGAGWLPGVISQFRVRGPLKDGQRQPMVTPPLGGTSISAGEFRLNAGWDRQTHLTSAAVLTNVELLTGGQVVEQIGDLRFGLTPSSWDPADLGKFTQLAFDAAGLWLMGLGGTAGVSLVAALGLLPDLAKVFNDAPEKGYPFKLPPGLTLPDPWPHLEVQDDTSGSFFAHPWASVRKQLAAIWQTPDRAEAMMRLLAWSVTGALPAAPDPLPKGDRADPWWVELTNVWRLQPIVWTSPSGAGSTQFGCGLRRVLLHAKTADVQLDVTARVDLARFDVATGQAASLGAEPTDVLPRFGLTCRFTNPDPAKPLVDNAATGLQIGSVTIGAAVDPGGVRTVVTLDNSRLHKDDPLKTFDVQEALRPTQDNQILETLLGVWMDAVSAASGSMPALKSMLDLLTQLGLVDPPKAGEDAQGYGINLGGWQSLVADPATFLSQQFQAVAFNPVALGAFFQNLATLTGFPSFQLPPSLAGLPDLLTALGLMQKVPGGYAPRLTGWLDLIQHPVAFLEGQGRRLLDPADASLREALVSALSKLPPPPGPLADLPLSIQNATLITLRLPADKLIKIGKELQLDAKLVLNLQALTLTSELALSSEFAGVSLAFRNQLDLGQAKVQPVQLDAISASWGLALGGIEQPGVAPPFDPVVIYPLPDPGAVDAYLAQIGKQVPILLVSSLATQLVNNFVVADPRYAVVRRLFEGLGLTVPDADGQGERVQSLVPLFMHPIDWLLSPQGLGDGKGNLSLDKIGTLLNKLPGPDGISGPGDIMLKASGANGMVLSGLPLGGSIAFASDSTLGVQIATAMSHTFDGPSPEELRAAGVAIVPRVEIRASMAFGTGSGVEVGGSIRPGFVFDAKGPTTLTVDSAFDSKKGFTLGIAGQLDGQPFPPGDKGMIALVPFGGLSQFTAGATALLGYASKQLITLYNDYKADPKHDPTVVTTVDSLMDVAGFFGVTSVDTLYTTFQQLADDPLAWLLSFFQEAKLPQSLENINKVLTTDLKLTGFSVSGTLLTYTPSLPTRNGTLSIRLGEVSGVFGVWIDPGYQRDWIAIGAGTGIGFKTPLALGAPLVFSLQASVGVAASSLPKPMTGPPTLGFGLGVGTATDLTYWLRFFPAGEGSSANTLLIDLLPTPQFAFGNEPTKGISAEVWLPKFTLQFLVPLIADIVLQTKPVGTWLDQPLLSSQPTSPPPGQLLADWGLLTLADKGPPKVYGLTPIDQMFTRDGQRLSVLEIVGQLFLVVLKGLSGFKIVPIGEKDGIYVATAAAGGVTDYGLRVQITDIGAKSAAAKTGSPAVLVQLGQWLSSAGDKGDNWIVASEPSLKGQVTDPGVVVFLVRQADGASSRPAIHPRLQLASLGVDVVGTGGKPLVDVKGFQLGKVEPRIFLSLDVAKPADFAVGAAIECRQIGIPLGPPKVSAATGNQNPVAANLLASGDQGQSGSDPKEKATGAVNPTFSAATGYVYDAANPGGSSLYFRVFSDDGTSGTDNYVWIPIQRGFGPLYCQKVGVGWVSPRLAVGFDGSVSLAGLSLVLENLKVGIPVKTPLDYNLYTLDLDGLDLSYAGGPVSISGGFLKTTYKGTVVYSGLARIQAGQFGLTAMGSYGLIGQDTPSVFVFALLLVPLGGPPYFFVEGVAAGFGYNRNLQLPDQDTVSTFPFVAGALDPDYFAGNNAESALQKISNVSEPQRGQYWVAAGIRFSSFKMINSFALLTVSFGTEFELALLGLSLIQLPTTVSGGASYTPIARAELQLLVVFKPNAGLLAATASLTKNSYVLDKSCQLTGGFAFYVWFPPNLHAGQFVVTLGGYHPRFKPPDYYPQEPQLGFTWLMPDFNVTIRGGCYFALTPAAVMAGGGLELLYQSGNLRAWFTAYANFLIQWKPFHYDIEVGVSVGASYRVDVLFIHQTFTIELGASVRIWGPPTGGEARISWWIISFTVSFGPGNQPKPKLDWGQFDESFLPQPQKAPSPRALAAGPEAAPLPRDPRLNVLAVNGLIKTESDEKTGEVKRWVINPQSFEVVTNSVVPATKAEVNGVEVKQALVTAVRDGRLRTSRVDASGAVTTGLGIAPMGATNLVSVHAITVTRANESTGLFAAVDEALFETSLVVNSVPRAMWNPVPPTDAEKLSPDQVLPNVAVGVRLAPRTIPYDSVVPIPMANLQFAAAGTSYYSWGNVTPPDQPHYDQNDTIQVEMSTLNDDDVAARRSGLLRDLATAGVPIDPDVNVSMLATTADQVFLAPPVLAPLGGLVTPLPR